MSIKCIFGHKWGSWRVNNEFIGHRYIFPTSFVRTCLICGKDDIRSDCDMEYIELILAEEKRKNESKITSM